MRYIAVFSFLSVIFAFKRSNCVDTVIAISSARISFVGTLVDVDALRTKLFKTFA